MATKALRGPVGPKNVLPYSGPASLTYGTGVRQGASDGTCIAFSAAGQKGLGIIESTDLVGFGQYGVVVFGETLGISNAAIPTDTEVMFDSTGLLVPSTAQGDFVVGRTRSVATAANQEVVLFVNPYIR